MARGLALVVVAAAAFVPPAGARLLGARASGPAVAFPRGAILFVSTRPSTVDDGSGVYAADASGVSLKELSVESGAMVRWSPDGRWIAFGRRRGESYDLYARRADGTRVRRLLRGDDATGSVGFLRSFSWSPDARRLVFTHGRAGAFQQSLSLVALDGRPSRRLTALVPRREDHAPAWSPDGRRIAFVRYDRCREPGGVCGGLYAVDINGRRTRRVFVSSSFTVVGRPSWSPDGRRIAVGLSGGGARVVDVERGTDRSIVATGTPSVAWAPNGRWIALGDSGSAIVRPDGSGYRRISAHGAGTPSWSPDSRAVAVAETAGGADIWVIAVDGSGERALTDGGRYGYENSQPVWNPRGLSTAQLAGSPASPANPTDSVVETDLLRSTRPIIRISADGSRVAAVSADGVDDSVGKVEVWDVEARRVARFPFAYYARRNTSFRSYAFGLAGGRVATTLINSGGGIDTWTVTTATLTTPRPTEFRTSSSTWPSLCCSTPLEHLAGDSELLVLDAWGPCRISQSQPCATGAKYGGRLLKIEDSRVVELASDRGALTLLSVDRQRILVDRENGALQLFGADGTPLRTITYAPAKLLGAAIEGDDIVVLTSLGLADYDAASGDLRRQRQLPSTDARLNDLADGVVAYTVGREIHLTRLRDDREAAIRPPGNGPVLVELERAGLFYAYAVTDAQYPGRLSFVPFDRLPLP